jgi:flagellar basal-body rod protein FlgB
VACWWADGAIGAAGTGSGVVGLEGVGERRMLIESVFGWGSLPVLERLAAFTEARHRVLLTNVANLETPGYRPKDVDLTGFQAALGEAVARRRAAEPLQMSEGKTWSFDEAGGLAVHPREAGPQNLLFHDGTNARVEREMGELAKNAMTHQVAVELLRVRYGGLLEAIRGRIA